MASRLKAVAPPGEPGFFTGFFARLRSSLASVGEQKEAPYKHNPWVYAANQAIAIPISGLPFKIMREVKQTATRQSRVDAITNNAPRLERHEIEAIANMTRARDRVRKLRQRCPWLPAYHLAQAATGVDVVEEGPWVDLFTKVNQQMTRSQLWEATMLYLGADMGECFWELVGKDGPVEPNEIPREIWPRSGRGFKAVFDDESTEIVGWLFESSFTSTSAKSGKSQSRKVKVLFKNDQVLHFHYFDPVNPIRGMSPLDPVREEIEAHFRATRWNTRFFTNGATIGGLLNIKGDNLSTQDGEALKSQIESRHRGEEQAHGMLLIQGVEAEFKEMVSTQKDMQFIEMLNNARDVIMATNRISKSALGLVEDQNRANLLASQRGTWENTLIPKVRYIEDLLDSDLFTDERMAPGKTVFGMFDLSEVEALQENFTDKLAHAKSFYELSYPVNKIAERLELGMEPLEWGDIGYVPTRLRAADALAPADEGTGGPPAPTPPPEEEAANAFLAEVKELDNYEHSERVIQKLFEPAEALYKRKYREFLKGLRRAQLRKIPDDPDRIAVPEQLLFSLAEQQRAVEAIMESAYRKIFEDSEADAVFEVSRLKGFRLPRQVSQGDKEAFIRVMGAEVQQTVKTMREQLRGIFTKALEEEQTAAQMEKGVREFFNHFTDGGKLGVIARTEAATTINSARQMTFVSLDVKFTEWLTAGDEVVRDTHVAYGAAGKKPIGFNWPDVIGASYTLKYPLDPNAPLEERVNCRCIEVPL